ncbi:hypothetical protein BGZ88_003257, partial [Linnemannia elongata]
ITAAKILEPYDRLEEWLSSPKHLNEFFDLTKSCELEDYADVKQFHRVQHLDYAAPPLTSSRVFRYNLALHVLNFKATYDS